jgi:thiazole/oxazole-forming peptide maturase SagD family component
LANHVRIRSGLKDQGIASQYGSAFETTFERALQMAVGEAVERYAGALYLDNELRTASAKELGNEAGPVDKMIGFQPETTKIPTCRFSIFDPTHCYQWVKGKNLATGRVCFMPAQTIIFDFPCTKQERITTTTTNGLAAGRDYSSAALSALLEVVERDAFSAHWLLGLSPLRIAAQEHELPEDLQPLFRSEAIDLRLFLLRSDIHVPIVLAAAVGRRTGAFSLGASARLDLGTAVRKAALEACHSWAFICEYRARGLPVPLKHDVKDFLEHAAFYSEPDNCHLADFLISQRADSITLEEARSLFPPDNYAGADGKLDELTRRLNKMQFDPLVFDRTSTDVQELGFVVVRGVIPGLQPLYAGVEWIPDDLRRLKTFSKALGLAEPTNINREVHPFP